MNKRNCKRYVDNFGGVFDDRRKQRDCGNR